MQPNSCGKTNGIRRLAKLISNCKWFTSCCFYTRYCLQPLLYSTLLYRLLRATSSTSALQQPIFPSKLDWNHHITPYAKRARGSHDTLFDEEPAWLIRFRWNQMPMRLENNSTGVILDFDPPCAFATTNCRHFVSLECWYYLPDTSLQHHGMEMERLTSSILFSSIMLPSFYSSLCVAEGVLLARCPRTRASSLRHLSRPVARRKASGWPQKRNKFGKPTLFLPLMNLALAFGPFLLRLWLPQGFVRSEICKSSKPRSSHYYLLCNPFRFHGNRIIQSLL
jgi:hypothetical protein